MVEMDQGSSLTNIYSALKRKICRIINDMHLPLKLNLIHCHGIQFILLVLCVE